MIVCFGYPCRGQVESYEKPFGCFHYCLTALEIGLIQELRWSVFSNKLNIVPRIKIIGEMRKIMSSLILISTSFGDVQVRQVPN